MICHLYYVCSWAEEKERREKQAERDDNTVNEAVGVTLEKIRSIKRV
jgi:hypothetical protein